jgi:hypothetical protein
MTVNVRPPMVAVPVRCEVDVLAATAKVTVPLPVPLPPALTVNHPTLLDAVHAQELPVVTAAVAVVAPLPTVRDAGATP